MTETEMTKQLKHLIKGNRDEKGRIIFYTPLPLWSNSNTIVNKNNNIVDEIMMEDVSFSCVDLVGKTNYIKLHTGKNLVINLNKVDINDIKKEPELGTIASLYEKSNLNKLYNVIWKYGWYDLSDNKWSYINRYNIMSPDYKITSSEINYNNKHSLWNYSEKNTDSNGNTIINNYVHENTNIIFKNTNIKCEKFKGDIIGENMDNIKIKINNLEETPLTDLLFNSISFD